MLKGFLGRKVATQCATCRFWQPDEEQEDLVLGECRMRAPEFNRVAPDPVETATILVGVARRPWPLTEDRDWCGAWKE
jgi:hypothetical protein